MLSALSFRTCLCATPQVANRVGGQRRFGFRGRQVPETHLAGAEDGVLVVNRWPSYQSLAKVKAGKNLLGLCWGHVRRDFLRVARDWPGQAAWGNEWLDAIGEFFHLNALRREVLGDPAAVAPREEALK